MEATRCLPLIVLSKATPPGWLPQKPSTINYFGTRKGYMTVHI